MNDDNGALSFATGIDTSGYDKGIKRMEDATAGLVGSVEGQTAKIAELLNEVPEINLQVTTKASDLDQIAAALQEVDRVVDENTKGIRLLRGRYKELGQAKEELAAKGQKGSSQYNEMAKEQKAILDVVKAREQAIAEAGKEGDALLKLEAELKTQANATEQNAQKQTSLRQRLRELKMELVEMEASGQRGTAAYRALQEETARLTDAMGDAQAQASILANDQRGFAGVMSGLTGLSGGFTAVTGAISLFGSENEDLQKIMMRLQAVMSITMGLQQVQQTLNKDSAFSLVTLNGLKEWWNKLLAAGTGEQIAATAAETADAAVQTADAAATTANAAAHEAKTAAVGESAVATGIDTVATGANAAAATAGTTANIGLAGAFRMVGMAIKSIPVFGWIAAAIGVLIGVIAHFAKKANALSEAVKQKNEMLKESRKVYAEASAEVKDYQVQIDDFNGTQAQEKKLVAELNGKYGEHLGYCKTLGEWKAKLAEKGDAYCEMMMMEAEAQAVLSKATDAYINLLEVKSKAESGEYDHWWQTKYGDEKSRQDAIAEAQAEVDKWQGLYKEKRAAMRQFSKNNDLGFHADPSKAVSINGNNGNSSSFDPKEAARQEREAMKTWEDAVKAYTKKANDEVASSNISYMQDGLEKQLEQSKANTKTLIEEWKEGMITLARARKQYLHDVYMSGNGATEEGWESSTAGQKSDEDYMNELLSDPKNAEMARQFQTQLARIEEEGTKERLAIQQTYQDSLIEKYGTASQKIEVLERQFQTGIMNGLIPEEYWNEAERQLNEQISTLKSADLKKSLNWEEVFGNLNAVASSSLVDIKKKLQDFIKTNKNLSPEAIKSIVEAIEKIDDKLTENNPFSAMCRDLSSLHNATRSVSQAQKDYNKALKEGTEEEQANAKETLDAARNLKQKALSEATQSLKAAATQAKELLNIGNEVINCFSAFGVDVPEQLTGFVSGIGKTIDSLSSIDLTSPMSIISGVVGTISGIASAIGSIFNNDSKHEKKIVKLQDQIDELEDAYADLEDAIEKAYSKDASNLIEQNNQLLEQRKALIQQQIEEEESKKKTDTDRIKEWQEKIEDINKAIEDNKQKATDAIFGEDLQSAIENFAEAYADAWAQGEDRAQSAKDTVKSMMQQMVKESIKAAIQSSGAMERIRQQLEEFYADNVLTGWEQDYVMQMAEDLQKQLDQQFGWADELLGGDASREGQSRGIATASQDSVDENNARLTTIQGHTYTLVQGMQELNRTSSAMLERLTGIERNTSETNGKLDDVQKTVKRINEGIDDITTHGLKLK